MGEVEGPEKPKRSKRLYVYWGMALALLVTVGLFSWMVVVPVWRVKLAVERCQIAKLNADDDVSALCRQEVQALGGPSCTARRFAIYLMLPRRWVPLNPMAVRMLGSCGIEAVPSLIKLLKSGETDDVRISAIACLGSLGDDRAVEPLIDTLKDKSPWIRYVAADSLGQLGDARAVRPLMAALDDVPHNTRVKVGENAGGYVPGVAPTAALALGEIGPTAKEAIPALQKAAARGHPGLKTAAEYALKQIRAPQQKDK